MIDEPLLLAAAIVIIFIVLSDNIWTIMGEGGGIITKNIMNVLWRISGSIFSKVKSRSVNLALGITVIITALLIMILLFWGGWFLLFIAGDNSVVSSITGIPAGFWEKIYFTGFTLFTLGTGDYVPNGNFWIVVTPLASLMGLFIITFSITYLVPVVSAAVRKRTLAVFISSLGNSSEAIIKNNWNGKNFSSLMQELNFLSHSIAELEQKHKAYPVLHYLQSVELKGSLALSLSRLDEALTILLHGYKEKHYDKVKVLMFKRNLDYFLGTLKNTFIKPSKKVPPLPGLIKIEESLETDDESRFNENIKNEGERRRLLYGMILSEQLDWNDISLDEEGS